MNERLSKLIKMEWEKIEKLLDYIKDFINIFEFIERKKLGILNLKTQELSIKKDDLIKMLEVNKYATADEKLRVWRALNFIKSDEDRFTKIIKENGKAIRVISLNFGVYKDIKSL